MGRVKTRLATTVGEETALKIYQLLLQKTRKVCSQLKQDKFLFYSDQAENDDWEEEVFSKYTQKGKSLGERMHNAFEVLNESGHQKKVIIGSDCYDISEDIIQSAFEALNHHDVVIGPANDGGYYLLGMNGYYPGLFQNVNWSTSSVLIETLNTARALKLKIKLIEELVDLDTFEDLKKSGFPTTKIDHAREN